MDATKKSQLEQSAVVVLLGVFAVTLIGALRGAGVFTRGGYGVKTSQGGPSILQAPSSVSTPPGEPSVASSPSQPPAQPTYTAQTLRDPLRSLLPPPPFNPNLPVQPPMTVSAPGLGMGPAESARPLAIVVQGLVWGGAEPRAIIDDEVYGVGDVVNGATITAIAREGITLEQGGRTMAVTIGQGQGAGKGSVAFPPSQGRW